ncbi:MAG: hypothetical protein R6V46_03750 [Desulfatiglandaceae bacterium]
MAVKKGWTYVPGHYKKDGTWVPPHRSVWRELVPTICLLIILIGVLLYLLFKA